MASTQQAMKRVGFLCILAALYLQACEKDAGHRATASEEQRPPSTQIRWDQELCELGPVHEWEPLPADDPSVRLDVCGELEREFSFWSQKRHDMAKPVMAAVSPYSKKFDPASGERYRLAKSMKTQKNGSFDQRYAMVDMQSRKVMRVETCADFNLLVAKTEHPWETQQDKYTGRAERYLRLMCNPPDGRKRVLIGRGKAGRPKSLLRWAAKQPGGPEAVLVPPRVKQMEKGNWLVTIRSWYNLLGLLVEERVIIDMHGAVVSHKRKILGEGEPGRRP